MYDLMSATYVFEQGQPVILLFVRDKTKQRKVIRVKNFRPYFWAPFNEAPNNNETKEDVLGRLVTKVYTTKPTDVRYLRRQFSFTDEANIPFCLRFCIDAGIWDSFKIENGSFVPIESMYIEPRILYFDIEVVSPPEIMPRPENPDYSIVCFSAYDSYEDQFVLFLLENEASINEMTYKGEKVNFGSISGKYNVVYCSDERNLLNNLARYLLDKEFDVLTGWWIEHYDLPYLHNRMIRLGLDPRVLSPVRQFSIQKFERGKKVSVHIGGCEVFDLLNAYMQFVKPEGQKLSWDLKYIVKLEAGYEYEDYGDRIDEVWAKDHKTLIEYCFNDVLAVKLVDDARKLIKYYDGIRRKVGTFLSMATTRINIVRANMWRITDKPVPTGESQQEASEVKGAYVECFGRGLYTKVATYDVKSMYPMVMLALNASKETKSKEGSLVAANGVRFMKSPVGLPQKAIKRLLAEKERIDSMLAKLQPGTPEYELLNTERETTKYTLNAHYGVTAYAAFELFDPDVTNAVTSTARMILTEMIRKCEQEGYKVLYCDTDSVHIKLKQGTVEEAKSVEQMLQDMLKSLCERLGYLVDIEVKFEKLFERVLYHRKKRYVGYCTYYKGKPTSQLFIYGLAAKRSDSSILTRQLQEQFFKALLVEGDIVKAVNHVHEAVKNIKSYPLWQIACPKGLQKSADAYEHFAWAEGVQWSEQHLRLKFREDQKPLLVYGYVKGRPKTRSFCIRLGDEIPDAVVDYEKMIDVSIRKKFEPLLEALGYDWTVVTSGTKQTSLEVYVS